MSQVARESSSETKIAPRSVRMVVCSGRGSADMGCLQSAWFSKPHNDRADRSPPPIGSTMTPTATCRDSYCYLPLYIFCGRHLLAAKLRRSNIDASAGAVEEVQRIVGQIRARWPRVTIVLRADSGFAREALMLWCEQNRVDFVLAWRAMPGLRPASRPPSKRPGPRLRRPADLRACSRTFSGRPSRRGHVGGAWSPRRNGPGARRTPAFW